MSYKITLDAGHGGYDWGSVYGGRKEKDDNLKIVLALGEKLKEKGFDVHSTRTTDIYHTPYEKASLANTADSNLFLSFHRNTMPIPGSARGVLALVYEDSDIRNKVATALLNALCNQGFFNLGIEEHPHLILLRKTKMPAVLIELGFLNHKDDNTLLDQYFQPIIDSLANTLSDLLLPDNKNEFPQYHINLGVYENRIYAERFLSQLLAQGFPAYIHYDGTYYRVQIGTYNTLKEAVEIEKHLRNAGYSTYILK